MSRVVRFYSLGGPDVLRAEQREVPRPAAGTVLAVGPGVTGIREGAAVGVLPGFDIRKYGTYADPALLPRR